MIQIKSRRIEFCQPKDSIYRMNMDIRIHGYMDTWVYGYMDIWDKLSTTKTNLKCFEKYFFNYCQIEMNPFFHCF